MRTHPTNSHSRRPQAAFTLIEVALSVAIAAFALVAIIGVMPAGLNVQRENREEAIINYDAKFLIDAIRSGLTMPNDLAQRFDGLASWSNGAVTNLFTNNITPPIPIPAFDIIRVLSFPGANVTNYAWVRGFNGSLGDTAGTNTDLMFAYKVSTHLEPYTYNPISPPPIAPYQSTNLWELRIAFEWPFYPNKTIGNGRQSYRVMIAGAPTNISGYLLFSPTHFQSP